MSLTQSLLNIDFYQRTSFLQSIQKDSPVTFDVPILQLRDGHKILLQYNIEKFETNDVLEIAFYEKDKAVLAIKVTKYAGTTVTDKETVDGIKNDELGLLGGIMGVKAVSFLMEISKHNEFSVILFFMYSKLVKVYFGYL